MLSNLKENLAYESALKAVSRRKVKADHPAVGTMPRVLIAMPHHEEDISAVWRFIDGLELAKDQMTLVRPSSLLIDVPARFVGSVTVLGSEHFNWAGLPKKSVVQRLWYPEPDVALDLHFSYHLPSTYLVGSSPARLRVGFYDERKEPFFDLLIRTSDRGQGALLVMKRYLRNLQPDALPMREP